MKTINWTNRILSTTIIILILGFFWQCSEKSGGAGGFSRPPMPVETATVTQKAVEERFETVGTIEAEKSITVVSEISALVTSLPFREGAHIGKGELIARLDDSQLGAEVERAEALRDQTQSSYDRIKTVVEQKAGAPQDLDDAAAALKVAEANLALAKARLSKTRIVAPFSGIIGSRQVSEGAFVNVGEPITDLSQIEQIRVNFSVPERYLSRLNSGAPVNVSTTAYEGYNLTGQVEVIEPILDPSTRSTRVVAKVRNPDDKLRPGMSANISILLVRKENALTIPSEAIFAQGSEFLVYVVNPDSTVRKASLKLGVRLSEEVEVTEGLTSGEKVVKAGHQKLFEGAKVMPIAKESGQPPENTKG
jgi:membrane fusion protein (multidrug efflux system)